MRKLVTMLLLVLIVFCNMAFAEGLDLTSMSLEELVELHKMIDAEIDARIGCEESTIPAGIYVAGESIKSGSYVISGNEEYYGIDVATFASKEIYEQAFAEEDESKILFQTYVSDGDSAFVKLDDGMVLIVSDTAIIEQAKADWML